MRSHSRLNLGLWFLAIAGIPALLRAMPAGSCPAPPLRSAASFAVLGRTVMSSGPSIVTGNLGVSSGTPAGFPPGRVNIGTTFHGDSTVQQAQNDATAAYSLSCGTCIPLTNPNLGGMTLGPGVYCSSSPLLLTRTLTLDAHDDPNAVWIFRTTNTLTTDLDASVLVTNGGWNGNVFWQAAGSVTLNASTTFVGNILTPADITVGTGVSVSGRLLAGGAVTLDNDNVSLCCDPITLSPATLPNGTVCTPYGNTTFSASGGTAPYSFSVTSGDLPDGLMLTGGVLSGTPSKKGSFSFAVTATDSRGCSGTRVYAIEIWCPPDDPIPLPPAKACDPYCQKITPGCGTGPLTSGDLPDWLTLFPDRMLCGTPTTPGDYVFTVADQTSGCTRRYVVQVAANVMISPASLPPGVVCTPYIKTTITPSCGTPPYTCNVTSGSLPDGLKLTGCVISGTPTVANTFSFTVRADDSGGSFTSQLYTILIICPRIPVEPPVLPPATTCLFYTQTLTRSCGTGPFVYSVTKGALPNGLSLSSGGVLSGTAMTIGDYSFTVTATDPVSGCPASTDYAFVVAGGVTLTPGTLPGGWPGVPYSEVITASGGTAPYTFVVAGTLPPGLTPSTTQTTLTISGTPTTAGCFPFTVTATDANGCFTSVTYTICVATGGPTLSGWGMVVLSILLVGAGLLMIRRVSGQ
ncbi:MAG TPA: IPTL-CTERM sorting domain-containing protein [Thermoanaerobaculia bacterium]|jgi:hypothetical protein|nr:IPTL-CTERM sorting domain-containing protein [Thermoanaerobaculia bacterium]